jgi:hypothetical protein
VVAMDKFTKWIEVRPIVNLKSERVFPQEPFPQPMAPPFL